MKTERCKYGHKTIDYVRVTRTERLGQMDPMGLVGGHLGVKSKKEQRGGSPLDKKKKQQHVSYATATHAGGKIAAAGKHMTNGEVWYIQPPRLTVFHVTATVFIR